MYRLRPDYERHVQSKNILENEQAKAIMLMIQNIQIYYAVAQHPHELITYGGNGAVFQNWAHIY
jgi:urocanate hydratase